jgi:hypothetical protein
VSGAGRQVGGRITIATTGEPMPKPTVYLDTNISRFGENLMTRSNARSKPIDDVERLRQVRRQIEREHPTLDSLFNWLQQQDQERIAREKRAAKKRAVAKTKAAPRPKATKVRARS